MIFYDVPPPIIAMNDSGGQEIQVHVVNDGIMLNSLRVNGRFPATTGANAGWVVTRNANNNISFIFNAPAGSVITLTDQRGNVLGTWDVATDTVNGVRNEPFTLQDGIGNYYLTVLITAPDSETVQATIPVKYLALDGGDVCDQAPLPPECLPPDTGEPPKIPDTGLKYVNIGGYAVPTYWVIISMLAIFGIGTMIIVRKNAKKQSVRFDKKVNDNEQETQK
jgi:hypothetical protein